MPSTTINNDDNPNAQLKLHDPDGMLEDDPEKAAIRNALRAQAIAKVRSGIAATTALTSADLAAYQSAVLSESGLEAGGALTHAKKEQWLHENVNNYIPAVIADAKRLEADFFSKISNAESNKWIGANSARKWKERLQNDGVLWMQKQQFLTKTFPAYYANWDKAHRDLQTAKGKIAKLGVTAKEVPEIAALNSADFVDMHYEGKKALINSALAAVAAYETNRTGLHKKTLALFEKAVGVGAMSPGKVGTWMRKIFEADADPRTIESFVDGRLRTILQNWTDVRTRFDKVEQKRENGAGSPGFSFVKTNQFLDWHYSARLSYVQEAERHINMKNTGEGYALILDIRREMAMKDWDSAQYLIDKSSDKDLSSSERSQIYSMQQYLNAHKKESEEDMPVVEESDPRADMYRALAELKNISPSIYNLYVKAAAKGYGTVSALNSIMYNRCWCHENGCLTDNSEEQLRQRSVEDTKEVLKEGHGQGYENNNLALGRDAVRDHDKNEWAPQVLQYSAGSESTLVAKCEANQNNFNFKYWTTLIPDGLAYEQHQYIVYNLGWRIKRGARAGATSESNIHLQKPSKKAA